jgi:hypothetical protein
MIRKRKRRRTQLPFNLATVRNYCVSTAVHVCPLLSKDLGHLAKTGCFHPDLLKMSRLCAEAVLSIQVQPGPGVTPEAVCTEARTGADAQASEHLSPYPMDASSLRPTMPVGEATKRPHFHQLFQGERP